MATLIFLKLSYLDSPSLPKGVRPIFPSTAVVHPKNEGDLLLRAPVELESMVNTLKSLGFKINVQEETSLLFYLMPYLWTD